MKRNKYDSVSLSVFVRMLFELGCNQSCQESEMAMGDRDRTSIPLPEPKFGGRFGKAYQESQSEWSALPTPPAGVPNVEGILLDDVGFGQTSTCGGPIPTPGLAALASKGLRHTRFHTTAIWALPGHPILQAEINCPDTGADAVLVAEGGSAGGFVWYRKDGKLLDEYNFFDEERCMVTSTDNIPVGKSTLHMDGIYEGKEGDVAKGGTNVLYANGNKIAEGKMDKPISGRVGIDTFGFGEDSGSPVSKDYRPPFKFAGDMVNVDIEWK